MDDQDALQEWISTVFSGKEHRKLKQRTERATLTIAPVFGGNTGSKQIPRWELSEKLSEQANRDALTTNEAECRKIRTHLLAQIPLMHGAPDMAPDVEEAVYNLLGSIEEPITCPHSQDPIEFEDLRRGLHETSVCGSDEIPIGFKTPPQEGGSFELGNIVWLKPPTFLYDLREYFDNLGDGGQKLLEKTQRKSYKTDRRLTGKYQTNREHRWEAHPQDPQAATRYECWRIEGKLLSQVFQFKNPPELPGDLRDEIKELLGDSFEETFHCPITGETVIYDEFRTEVLESDHGRSGYQIGHLDPLAISEGHHEMENVSWISERGNRVQGEDALKETVRIIFDMAEFHMDRIGLDWEDAIEWEPNPTEPSSEIAAED